MKNYVRLVVLALAALFTFAACDSSGGGGEEQQEEPANISYMATTGGQTVELKLIYDDAANSPARNAGMSRASGSGRSGTYDLKVNGSYESVGKFVSNGNALEFTSDGSSTFKANVADGGALTIPEPVLLEKKGETLKIPAMKEDYTLRIFGQQLHDIEGNDISASNTTLYARTLIEPFGGDSTDWSALEEVGSITTDGKLTLNLPEFPSMNRNAAGHIQFYIMDGQTEKVIALELLKRGGGKDKAQEPLYFAAKEIDGDNVFIKGWNLCYGTIDRDMKPAHLEWYEKDDYEWVYNENPIVGTFKDDGSTSDTFILKADKTFEVSGTLDTSGNYSIDSKQIITFTPNQGQVFYRDCTFYTNGALLIEVDGKASGPDGSGRFLRIDDDDDSIW